MKVFAEPNSGRNLVTISERGGKSLLKLNTCTHRWSYAVCALGHINTVDTHMWKHTVHSLYMQM